MIQRKRQDGHWWPRSTLKPQNALQERYGQVWNTSELAYDFEVLKIAAPFAIVKRKADNRMSLMFQHHP